MKKPSGVRGAFIVLLFSIVSNTGAQGLFKISLEEKISNSSIIVEGKVISQVGFWNEQNTMIYTSNKVEVYKLFKGVFQKKIIDVITVGGSVGNQYISASHQLTLEKDDVGVFFCRQFLHKPLFPGASAKGYDVYSSSQGFIKYDHLLQSASAPFVEYKDIGQQLYRELRTKTGKAVQIINPSFRLADEKGLTDGMISSNQVAAPLITSFSPTTVDAGALLDPANNVLTITGTGFGAVPAGSAAVLFDNPDDGSGGAFGVIAYNSPLIVSWSDVQIQVRVPSSAGTGTFVVRDNAGVTINSPTALTVRFNVIDANFVFMGNPYVKEIRLINSNGLGGYTIFYSNNTANGGVNMDASPAKETFQRALTTWKENSGFNVTEGGSNMQQSVNPTDAFNMIMFDNSSAGNSPLPAGVLGTCVSGVSICTDNITANQAYKIGFDIVIRNEGVSLGAPVGLAFGPCSPFANNTTDVDLESILFHELGHAINMGHIIDPRQGFGAGNSNPAKVMNFALARGLRRVSEDQSSRAGASYLVTPRGVSLGSSCGPLSEMVPLATISEAKDDCPSSFPVTSTPVNTTVAFDLVHATSNKFSDPDYLQATTDATGTGITNTAYYAFRTNSVGGTLSLNVSGYTTLPASAASCVTGPPGIPITGIQMVIYQVPACPTGLAFPTPVVHTSFQSNGMIPAINGLAPNTSYLMLLDGVENTKAYFSLTFSGASLPLRITEFNGRALVGINRIWWKTELAHQVNAMRLERSADGIVFDVLTSHIQLEQGTYDDVHPLAGDSYYRLAVTNEDGTIQYSRVIMLGSREEFMIHVFPNPARQFLNLAISHNKPGRYSILVHNSAGQPVLEKRINILQNNHVEKLEVGAVTPGIYHISVFSQSGVLMRSVPVTLK